MIASFYTSISGVVKAELFLPEVRALGVGLSYPIANAMFGGTAEYVALWLKSAGQEQWFFWYVAGMVAITFAASLSCPTRASMDISRAPEHRALKGCLGHGWPLFVLSLEYQI